jgi:hypothetical protein
LRIGCEYFSVSARFAELILGVVRVLPCATVDADTFPRIATSFRLVKFNKESWFPSPRRAGRTVVWSFFLINANCGLLHESCRYPRSSGFSERDNDLPGMIPV